MIKNNLSLKLLVIIGITLVFAGCTHTNNSSIPTINQGTSLEDKNAEFTISGKLTSAGGTFFVTDNSGFVHDVESYSIELENYLGEDISVTGQYSGNTLFVSSIEQL